MIITDGHCSVRNSVGIYQRNTTVGIYRRNYRRNIQNKKKDGSLTWNCLRAILPMESPRDSNQDLRTVTWSIHRQNCRQNESVGDSIGKSEYITTLPTLSSPISPSSSSSQLSPPKLQTTTQKKSPFSQHKSYFFKFCGHNIRVLIYCGFYHFL